MFERLKEMLFGPPRHFGFKSDGLLWLDCYVVGLDGRRSPIGPELTPEDYAELKAEADARLAEPRNHPNPKGD